MTVASPTLVTLLAPSRTDATHIRVSSPYISCESSIEHIVESFVVSLLCLSTLLLTRYERFREEENLEIFNSLVRTRKEKIDFKHFYC
jgi:hypothetical protein